MATEAYNTLVDAETPLATIPLHAIGSIRWRMELAFKTKQLRSICEDEHVAAELFDVSVVESLKRRLADLRAADSVVDLVAGRPKVRSDVDSTIVLDLAGGYELVSTVNHPNPPVGPDGRLDWSRVRRLQVTEIAEREEFDA